MATNQASGVLTDEVEKVEEAAPLPPTLPRSVEDARLLSSAVTRSQLMRLAQKGLNASEAAKIVGCSPQTARLHYAAFRREVLERVESVFADVDAAYAGKRKLLHELLEDQAYKSFTDLLTMLDAPNLHPALRVKINQDFLDRVEDTQKMHKVNTGGLTADALASAAKTAREMDNVIEMKKVG